MYKEPILLMYIQKEIVYNISSMHLATRFFVVWWYQRMEILEKNSNFIKEYGTESAFIF